MHLINSVVFIIKLMQKHSVRFCISVLLSICFFVNGCSLLKTSEHDMAEKRKQREEAELQAQLDAQAGGENSVGVPFVFIPNPYPIDESAVPKSARNEFAKVKVAMAEKNWPEAESQLMIMSTTYPTLSGIYVNLGIVYLQLAEFEEAERALQFAIETNKTNFDAYTVLGVVYREQGKFAEAEKNYLDALTLWPHHAASQRNLGILYDLYLGKFEQALVHYKISQQIAGGDDRELMLWIVDIERRIAELQPAQETQAEQETQAAQESQPDNSLPAASPSENIESTDVSVENTAVTADEKQDVEENSTPGDENDLSENAEEMTE